MSHAHIDLVERFVGALEAGDLEALNRCFAPDAQIWHNFDQVDASPEQNAASVKFFFQNFTRRQYRQRKIVLLEEGALLQFVVSLEKADGRTFDWPGCVVFRMADGKIARLQEYVDLSSLAAAMG